MEEGSLGHTTDATLGHLGEYGISHFIESRCRNPSSTIWTNGQAGESGEVFVTVTSHRTERVCTKKIILTHVTCIPYSGKLWQGFQFGKLTILRKIAKIKIRYILF